MKHVVPNLMEITDGKGNLWEFGQIISSAVPWFYENSVLKKSLDYLQYWSIDMIYK